MIPLHERIRAGARARCEILWPGTDIPVFVRVLSKAELQEAAFAADKRFRVAGVQVQTHTVEAYADEETVQILYRALSGEDGKPVAPSVEQFRGLLNSDVQTALARAYKAHEEEISPDLDKLDEAGFAELLDALRKNAEATIGCVSSIATARRLLRSLVAQLQN